MNSPDCSVFRNSELQLFMTQFTVDLYSRKLPTFKRLWKNQIGITTRNPLCLFQLFVQLRFLFEEPYAVQEQLSQLRKLTFTTTHKD